MSLKFEGAWRFTPPADGSFLNRAIPREAVEEFIGLVHRVATQGDRQEVLEHFKGHFCQASGSSHYWSSSTSWAETDLWQYAEHASQNAPLFIEAFYDACDSFRRGGEDRFAPDVAMINEVLKRHGIGYEIRPPRLVHRGSEAPLVPVSEPPTLAESAIEVLQTSLRRSEELLTGGRGREAVQESLWLIESVTTAFRGLDTGTNTIEGRYFNQIARELRQSKPGSCLDRVLDWMTNLHGYLSSPTGGGVRHGLDLSRGVAIDDNEARLFCNLIRSYLHFLLVQHERLARKS